MVRVSLQGNLSNNPVDGNHLRMWSGTGLTADVHSHCIVISFTWEVRDIVQRPSGDRGSLWNRMRIRRNGNIVVTIGGPTRPRRDTPALTR